MPKMKTHSGAKKRFRLTGSGKVRFKHAKMRHIQEKLSKKTKRRLRQPGVLAEVDAKHIRRQLGKG
ncbi:MAG: 50S ribosomal protein L35 [Deltaproteobacteria bacterium]|nr:MAG: 50S ribosomal protein L35 [Deltaproteobacteria bacterium]